MILQNEEIYVNEELGTMLISKGLLLADQRSAYVSSFIRVPNPLSNVNLCNLGCGRGSVILRSTNSSTAPLSCS